MMHFTFELLAFLLCNACEADLILTTATASATLKSREANEDQIFQTNFQVVETQKTGDSVEIESKEPVEPDVQTARTAYSDTKTAIPAIEPIKEEYALMKRSKPTEKMSSEPYVEPTPAVERTAPEPAISNVPSEMDVKTARSPFGDRSEDVFSELGEDVDLRQVLMDLDMNTLQGVRADVLRTLDSVLDKTIEYFINNKIDVLDPEIKNLIKERRALKAAMLDTMLKKPSYVPTEWVKKFEDYHEEALRETSGINWTQIMFLYPRQRTFDDESPDIFGNFTRAQHTNWLWGCIVGPNDSKTFDEVEREKASEGLFMDTKIMRRASAQFPDEPSSRSTGTETWPQS
ncbi:hypothetical protein Q1695_008893 [Nippostrongylus brasiliensis]|nr:hypothetical protein Q1695_008893 [Nippostrongylus brasiliensis]